MVVRLRKQHLTHRSKIPIEEIIPSSLYFHPSHPPTTYLEADKSIPVLAANIKKSGLKKPITVRKISDDLCYHTVRNVNLFRYRLHKNVKGSENFEIYEGIRRYWAFKQLNKKHPRKGWDKIPAIVIDDPEALDIWINPHHFPNHLMRLREWEGCHPSLIEGLRGSNQ